jgi:hypothetical protein
MTRIAILLALILTCGLFGRYEPHHRRLFQSMTPYVFIWPDDDIGDAIDLASKCGGGIVMLGGSGWSPQGLSRHGRPPPSLIPDVIVYGDYGIKSESKDY